MWIYTSTPPCAFMAYCLISYAQGQLLIFKHVKQIMPCEDPPTIVRFNYVHTLSLI
jgi:hypothetical protein